MAPNDLWSFAALAETGGALNAVSSQKATLWVEPRSLCLAEFIDDILLLCLRRMSLKDVPNVRGSCKKLRCIDLALYLPHVLEVTFPPGACKKLKRAPSAFQLFSASRKVLTGNRMHARERLRGSP